MKKRILSCILVLALAISLMPSAFAATDDATSAAQALYEMGLFLGTGNDANGNPIFDLDRTPNRNAAVIMLVRLLGKEQEAKAGTWNIPFSDVSEQMNPYVGYAYNNGLTAGVSTTAYGGTAAITASQYLTFVLRALGYTSGTDFQVSKAWELSDKIGLTDGQYNASTTKFTRGDVAIISANALKTSLKGQSKTLILLLVENGVIDSERAEKYLSAAGHSASLTWRDVFDGRVYVDYVKMDSGYYTLDTYTKRISCVNGEIYLPIDFYEHVRYGLQLNSDTDLLALLSEKYTVKKTENPYFSGKLHLFSQETNPYHIQTNTVYLSPTDSYTTWQLTRRGKTISSPSTPTKDEFVVDGIRYVGLPVSGSSEVKYWVNVNDLCKACCIDKRFSYFEKDTGMGLEHVLAFE